MSTKNDFTQENLLDLSKILMADFGSIEALNIFWHTHSRRQIQVEFKLRYNCSYYYARKIFLNLFNFSDRSTEETKCIQKINADNTKLKRYGRTDIGQFGSVEYLKAIKSKYGVENVANLPGVKLKKANTCMQKYGACTNLIGNAAKEYRNKKYFFNDCYFDSSWELALWIYAKDHNEEIIREPIKFVFTFNSKQHFYTPDFLYKGKLLEIKGNQFLDKKFGLKNPYDATINSLYQEKYKCIIQNNVEIWSYIKIKPFLLYIKNTYGKDYLKKFRV